MGTEREYVVAVGTSTAVVRATNRDDALARFCRATGQDVSLCTRDRVRVRRAQARDVERYARTTADWARKPADLRARVTINVDAPTLL